MKQSIYSCWLNIWHQKKKYELILLDNINHTRLGQRIFSIFHLHKIKHTYFNAIAITLFKQAKKIQKNTSIGRVVKILFFFSDTLVFMRKIFKIRVLVKSLSPKFCRYQDTAKSFFCIVQISGTNMFLLSC